MRRNPKQQANELMSYVNCLHEDQNEAVNCLKTADLTSILMSNSEYFVRCNDANTILNAPTSHLWCKLLRLLYLHQ